MPVRKSDIESVYPDLRKYAFKLIRYSYEDAEDLVQDTVVRMLEKWDSFLERDSSLKSWSLSVMHNLFIDQVRIKKLKTPVYLDELDRFSVSIHETNGREDKELLQVRFRKVKNFLKYSNMKDEYFPIFFMRSIGMKYSDISSRLNGEREGILRSRMWRVREFVLEAARSGKISEAV